MSASSPLDPPVGIAARKPTLRFLLSHPAHFIALGAGSGLSPVAPGTAGTLFAWLLYAAFGGRLDPVAGGVVIAIATLVGWWASTLTARHLAVADPAPVVCDEIVAFWLVLWLVTPAGFWPQAAAFVLFRVFDAAKPGPVAWADGLYPLRRGDPIGWRRGFSIMLDDFVAAFCTLLLVALWRVI